MQDMERRALPRGKILVLACLIALAACAGLYGASGLFESGSQAPQRKVVRTQGQARDTAARPAKTTGQAATAETDTARDAGSGAADAAAAADPVADKSAVRLPSIASFEPGTVYSGTLGEITRLQAGSQIARADLALREVQVKLKEMERRLAGEAGEVSQTEASQAGQKSLEKRIQEAISSSLQATVQAEMSRALGMLERQKSQSLRVVAVRGQGAHLEAELAGPKGRLVVRAGESLGAARVDSISRTRVVVDGTPLPWR